MNNEDVKINFFTKLKLWFKNTFEKITRNMTKQSVLIILVSAMGVVSVLMNTFAGVRPFYTEGAHGIWRAISLSTLAVSWLPLLIGDLLADKYGKKIAIGVPAFIFALQAIIFSIAVASGYTGEGWQNLWAGIVGNYAGLIVNFLVFKGLKKVIGTKKWYTFMIVAIGSTVFGQLADNTAYMMLSPYQWADGVFIGFAKQWETINLLGEGGVWTSKVSILGWDSMFLKSAFEIGMEVLVYPLTFLVSRFIDKLPKDTTTLLQNRENEIKQKMTYEPIESETSIE